MNFNISAVHRWGSGGGQSWPYLQEFNLDANLLTGTLPSSWGANGSMPAVEIIIASRNQLTGSIPPSWGSSTAGIPRFANLSSLTLLPGLPTVLEAPVNPQFTCGLSVLGRASNCLSSPFVFLALDRCTMRRRESASNPGDSEYPASSNTSSGVCTFLSEGIPMLKELFWLTTREQRSVRPNCIRVRCLLALLPGVPKINQFK